MRRLFCIIIILTIGKSSLFAQDSTMITNDTTRWNLAACVDYAQRNNITINTLRLNAKYNEQDIIAAKAQHLPNLAASVSEGVTHYNSGFYSATGLGASSALTLYNGGYIKNNIQSAELSQQVSNLNVAAANNDITLNITQAYLNILLARETIVYQQDVVNTSAAVVQQSQQRYDTGMIVRKTCLKCWQTLANDKYILVTDSNALRQND